MNNPLWEWLVRTRISAWEAARRFACPEASPDGDGQRNPAWCFDRMGQSVTPLPDGRVVLVAGEHEDHYDPEFHIYNDVTVCHPDGSLDIFGYPREVFPPTDFHSATLRGDKILIVGNLGHGPAGKTGSTQVAELDLKTFAIRLVSTGGQGPGWIHKHAAELTEDGNHLRVRGGLVDPGGGPALLENPDEWSLDLTDWKWSRITRQQWTRFLFRMEGMQWIPLLSLESLKWALERIEWEKKILAGLQEDGPGEQRDDQSDPAVPEKVPPAKRAEFRERFGRLGAEKQADAAELYEKGYNPDLALLDGLCRPPVDFQESPEPPSPEEPDEECGEEGPFDGDEEDYSRPAGYFEGKRIIVDGLTVRYKTVPCDDIQLVIEGVLPEATERALTADLKNKLERLFNRAVTCAKLD